MSEDPGQDRRTIERAVIMHGTSPSRLEAARLLGKVVLESGAWSAAYTLSDTLAPRSLTPVYTAAGGPRFRWATTLPRTFVKRIEGTGDPRWRLAIHGASQERLKALEPLLSLTAVRLRMADLDDGPIIPDPATRGVDGRFIALLDALRFVSFQLPRPSDTPRVAADLRWAIRGLPTAAHAPAEAVAEALHDPDRLARALLVFGRTLERDGHLRMGAATYVILYELALLGCDVDVGLDAAQGAGRAFRKLAEWREAMRWYQLGFRLAVHRQDLRRAARVLDGLGNTHRERGAFPAARRCYREASRLARVAGDPVEVGNVALGLMTVEREAGRLDVAARIAWHALRAQTDPRQRVNLLLNLGTLLRDGGALELAEDTYRLVADAAQDHEVRVMALDALAYCAALRGALPEYERRRRSVRGLTRRLSPYIRAQIGFFRGASLRALADERARRVLGATERFARAHGLREWEVRAGELAVKSMTPTRGSMVALRPPTDVREGIRGLVAAARGNWDER